MEIKLEKVTQFVYKAFTPNNKYLGTFELDESGFYNYWRNPKSDGAWQAWLLRVIADKLDEINKPYKEVVDEYFEQEKKDLEVKLRKVTNNFVTGFDTSTLMSHNNYHSGYILVDNTAYSIVKYKGKVRVWDKPKNYMAWVNEDKDYILEITI